MTVPRPTLTDVRVLVVEDDEDSREATATLLTLCGARATAVASVAEALASVGREAPDVIVADIAMPVEDGFALVRRLRAGAARGIPLIALTACVSPDDEARILAAGYDAYLAKPIDASELVAAVERFTRV